MMNQHTGVGDIDIDEDSSPVPWPASALVAAELGFQQLTRARTPVAFDARGLGHGLPQRHIPLEELRELLVREPRLSREAKDAAWHQIIDHARVIGQPWIAAAVGIALPQLVAMAARLRPGREQAFADVESELITGFIHSLLHDDLTGPRPQLRMCWAGWRAAVLVRDPTDSDEVPDLFDPWSRTPSRPYGHPDLLLGRAARLGIISPDDAELISETRFGRILVEQVATRRGVNAAALRMRRRRAELAVAWALAGNGLGGPVALHQQSAGATDRTSTAPYKRTSGGNAGSPGGWRRKVARA